MAKRRPDDLSGLTTWVKASDLYNEGILDAGAVGTLFDRSGNGFNQTQGTAAAKPTFRQALVNGRGAARFDGTDDFMQGAVQLGSGLLTAAQGLVVAVAKVIAINTNDASIQVNNHVFGDSNDVVGIALKSGNGGQAFAFNHDGTYDVTPGLAAPAGGTYIFAWWHDNAGKVWLAVNDLRESAAVSVASGNTSSTTGLFQLADGGISATRFGNLDLYELVIYNVYKGERNRLNLQIYFEEEYFGRVHAINQVRDVASRRLGLKRVPSPMVVVPAPAAFMDVEIGTDFSLSHYAYPEASGQGAGIKRPQRRLVRCESMEYDPMSPAVVVEGRDVRGTTYTLRDGLSGAQGTEEMANGVWRTMAGGLDARLYVRQGEAWYEDPASGLIVLCNDDVEKIQLAGSVLEPTATNHVNNGNFAGGFTSWTTQNAALDTADLITDPAVSGNSAKLTVAAGPTAAHIIAAATITLDAPFRIGVWHQDEAGTNQEALSLEIQRASDSKWFRFSDLTWQVAETDNFLPIRSDAWRDISPLVDPGGSTTITVKLRGITTAGAIHHVYWVTLEGGLAATNPPTRCVTSPMPGGSTVFRMRDRIIYDNPASIHLSAVACTVVVRVETEWDYADLASGSEIVLLQALWSPFDNPVNEALRLSYVQSTQKWTLKSIHSGSAQSATSPVHQPKRGVPFYLAFRITSGEGEQDLPNNTMSVFVEGVKGTDFSGTTKPTESAAGYVQLLGQVAASVRELDVTPLCLSDAEILQRCKPATNAGIVAFWPMEKDGASGLWRDSVMDNHLTPVNGPTVVAGKIGNAASFASASSQYLQAPPAPALDVVTPWTIYAWVNLTTKAALMAVVAKGSSQQATLAYDAGADRFRCNFKVTAFQGGSPSTGAWYLVVGWSDGLRTYIQVNDGPVDVRLGGTLVTHDRELTVGCRRRFSDGVYDLFLDGKVDSVGLWNRVLDARERADLYNAGAGKEWPF